MGVGQERIKEVTKWAAGLSGVLLACVASGKTKGLTRVWDQDMVIRKEGTVGCRMSRHRGSGGQSTSRQPTWSSGIQDDLSK